MDSLIVLKRVRLALRTLGNNYLSEMTTIAIECGGTIDKFIGDAVMVFFGDPETLGEEQDACTSRRGLGELGVRAAIQQWPAMEVECAEAA